MRSFSRLVVVGFLGLLLGFPPASASAETGALKLDVTTSKPTYPVGEAISLKFTVTNQGSAPCHVVALPDGTVDLTEVTKDGKALQPSFGRRQYYFGYSEAAAGARQSVNPGASVSFELQATKAPGQGQESMALPTADPLPDGDGLLARWPVASEGKYSVSTAYALAPANGGCTGSTNVATVAFTVGAASDSSLWTWVAIGGGALLLALLVIFLLVKGRRPAAAAVLLVLLGGAMTAVDDRPASAAIVVSPDIPESDFAVAANGCLADFARPGNDPSGLMAYLNDSATPRVTLLPRYQGDSKAKTPSYSYVDGEPGQNSDLYWTHTDGQQFQHEPGLAREACSELYHELAHAFDNGKKELDESGCRGPGDTKTSEVRASLAENAYRAAKNLPQHTTYDGPALPKSMKECEKKGPKPKKTPKACAQSATGPGMLTLNGARQQPGCDAPPPEQAATSDGDPHIGTFDHRGYDFQAVGEFVAAKSTAGDLEIQTRQSPVDKDRTASLNTAVALKVGADRVGFYLRDGEISVNVNTKPTTLARIDLKLPGGGVVKRRGSELPNGMDGYTVRWPDGSAVWLDPIGRWGIRMFASLAQPRAKQVAGLLGNFDGDPANDLVAKDGKAVTAVRPSYDELYRTFGDSWRVAQAESLFDYGQGENTDKFTDRGFPDKEAKDIPEAQRESAKLICERAGVVNPALLDGCVLDVVTMGQPTLAVNAGSSQEVLPANGTTAADPNKVVPGGTIRDGSTVAGEIKSPDERDRYDLVLTEAAQFSLVDVQGNVDLRLVGAEGNVDSPVIPGPYQYSVTAPGTYHLEVTLQQGATGQYSFRLVERKVRTFQVKVGDSISAGRLDTPGRVDVYVFDTAGAGRVKITDARPCEDVNMGFTDTPEKPRVATPAGLCWEHTSGALDEAGKLAIAVWSDGGELADYAFKIEEA